MIAALTRLARRAPRTTLAGWSALVVLLSIHGYGVERQLSEGRFVLPGTEAADAERISHATFGETELTAVLLEGPRSELREQGEQLVRALRRRAVTISPWDPGSPASLRPDPEAALVLTDLDRPTDARAEDVLRPLRASLHAHVRAPVSARVTSNSVLAQAAADTALDAAAKAQRIALPLLVLVLLLVFRSPVAAAIPGMVGLATIGAAPGIIALLSELSPLSAIAVSIAAMMGLALGVDYSLLIVSRFREELRARPDAAPRDAVAVVAATALRTVTCAGAALLVAMAVAMALSPGAVLISIAVGVAVAVAVSVVSAATAVPAALVLVGRRIDRWSIGSSTADGTALVAAVRRATRRPLVTAGAVALLMLALAAPLLGLVTSPPNLAQLPADEPARADFERIRAVLGPGWVTPFEIDMRAAGGPVTQASTLRAIEDLQAGIGHLRGVIAVIGPGALASGAAGVDRLLDDARAASDEASRASSGLRRLREGLASAAAGAGAVRDGARRVAAAGTAVGEGATRASSGIERARGGTQRALAGSRLLTGGLDEAAAAARTLRGGARRLDGGAEAVDRGLARASTALRRDLIGAAQRLADGLAQAQGGVSALQEPVAAATARLDGALRALKGMTVGRADPRYGQAIRSVGEALALLTGVDPATGDKLRDGYDGASTALAQATSDLQRAGAGASGLASGLRELDAGLRRARRGASDLRRGAARLASGNDRLAGGVGSLAAETKDAIGQLERLGEAIGGLSSGASTLRAGAERLRDSGELAAGAGRLRDGLSSGYRESGRLSAGVGRAQAIGLRVSGLGAADGDRASGHLVLAGVDVASTGRRNQVALVVNTRRGATGARLFVLPSGYAAAAENRRLHARLFDVMDRFGAAQQLDVAVGGLAGVYVDYERRASEYIPVLIAVLSAITFILLVVVLRALLLPLVAVVLNLVVVAAAFGAMTLAFQGSPPPLGGPGFIDILSVAGIFTILFALSIDYEMFLLTRMREAFDRTGDADAAVLYGIGRTARVVTGAALVMTVVFLTFAISPYSVLRQFGGGLAIAVLLDALALRMLLLPAVMRLMGAKAWWLPRGLERVLPRIAGEGRSAAAGAA